MMLIFVNVIEPAASRQPTHIGFAAMAQPETARKQNVNRDSATCDDRRSIGSDPGIWRLKLTGGLPVAQLDFSPVVGMFVSPRCTDGAS
jgi:hypothetical protein